MITPRYTNQYVVWAVSGISLLLAAILLVGAIASLYAVHNPKAKLGMIGAYTLLFAFSLVILTNARTSEVFEATAAYAAVLVVFVSGDLGRPKGVGGQCLLQIGEGIFKSIPCPSQ